MPAAKLERYPSKHSERIREMRTLGLIGKFLRLGAIEEGAVAAADIAWQANRLLSLDLEVSHVVDSTREARRPSSAQRQRK